MARETQQIGICPQLILVAMFLFPVSLMAQSADTEYQMDFGASVGTSFYLGDANGTPYAHMGAMGGLIVRRIFNPRMALKGNLSFGHISGTSEDYFIPTDPWSQSSAGGLPTQVSFSRNLMDIGVQFEMNFWGFGMGTGYKETSRITPYMLGGVGCTTAFGGAGTRLAMNLPVGLGVKYKVSPRLNVGLEWTIRFTTTDELDVPSDEHAQLKYPYGIKSSGFKNKDCYCFTMAFVTYDMCPKRRKCNNE